MNNKINKIDKKRKIKKNKGRNFNYLTLFQ